MDPKDKNYSQEELDNHSNQLNDNNDAYWQSRGHDERPDSTDDDDHSDSYESDDDGHDSCMSDDY